MSDANEKIEWYLARDGQQHGPLSDAELKKFRELGHLKANDLVWRAGFAEWRTAREVFPDEHPVADVFEQPVAAAVEAADEQHPETAPEQKAEQPDDVVAGTEPELKPEPETSGGPDKDKLSEPEDEQTTAGEPEPEKPSSYDDFFNRAQKQSKPQGGAGEPAQASASAPQSEQAKHNTQSSGPSFSAQRQPAAASGHEQGQQQSPQPQPQPQSEPRAFHTGTPAAQQLGNMAGRHGMAAPQTSSPYTAPMNAGAAAAGPNSAPSHGDPRFAQPQQGTAFNAQGFAAPQTARPFTGFQQAANAGAAYSAPNPHVAAQYSMPKPAQAVEDDEFDYDDEEEAGGRSYLGRAVLLAVVFVIGVGGVLVYANQGLVGKVIADLTADPAQQEGPAVVEAPSDPVREALTSEAPAATPSQAASAASPRLTLMAAKFWTDMRGYDPAWASRQEQAIEKLRSEGRPEAERLEFAVSALVDWRRSNADKILTASPEYLRQLARAFITNLKHLVSQNVKACYGFISQGELSPSVLPMYNDPLHLAMLGTQSEAIIAAAGNNNAQTTQYGEPSDDDFKALTQLLFSRGWTESDVKLFSNPSALSSAPESTVCKLVTEWFETQLQMPPGEQQMRLLATSLQPVIRG